MLILKKILAISMLALIWFAGNAAIITGDLSYDDSGSRIITNSNGLRYLGWGEIALYNYAQTLEATSDDGLYYGYHIADQSEAEVFFTSATGIDTSITNGTVVHNMDGVRQDVFGDNFDTSNSFAFFLADITDGGSEVGHINTYVGNIRINNSWSDMADSQYHGQLNEPISWLLVSNRNDITVIVSAPSAMAILGLGLMSIVTRRFKKKD
jgi:hypothetical protein